MAHWSPEHLEILYGSSGVSDRFFDSNGTVMTLVNLLSRRLILIYRFYYFRPSTLSDTRPYFRKPPWPWVNLHQQFLSISKYQYLFFIRHWSSHLYLNWKTFLRTLFCQTLTCGKKLVKDMKKVPHGTLKSLSAGTHSLCLHIQLYRILPRYWDLPLEKSHQMSSFLWEFMLSKFLNTFKI